MASNLTNKGQQYALMGNTPSSPSNGGIARLGTKLKLYTSASVPSKTGVESVDFIEAANGGGYTTGGIALTSADYTFSVVSSNGQIVIADKTWTGSGGGIANIGGAYLTDASNVVLAWWERASPLSLAAGDTETVSQATIRAA